MYASYFGLQHPPFSIAPDPRFLYMSERHREALAHLLYGVNAGGGFVLLTGEIGAGKTTVCRCFLEQIPRRCNVAYIFNPKLSAQELLQTICEEFRIPAGDEAHSLKPPSPSHAATAALPAGVQPSIKASVDALNEFLLKTHAVGQNNVLIVDEAQNLSIEVLEQLRLLTNLETNERKLLQIILIGQPELRQMLAQPELEQLAQRVIARYHLEALSLTETGQYIAHRLATAGLRRGRLFDSKAVEAVHRHSHGIPRRINLLCDRALLGAYAHGRTSVNVQTVQRAATEVFAQHERGPLEWAESAMRGKPEAGASQRQSHWLAGMLGAGLSLCTVGVALWLFPGHRHASVAHGPASEAAAQGAHSASGSSTAGVGAGTGTNNWHASRATPNTLGQDQALGADAAPSVWRLADQDESAAWSQLVQQWGVNLGSGEPCAQAHRLGLLCHRQVGGLETLRQLDRPALLTLHLGETGVRYAVITRLLGQQAQLSLQGQLHTVAVGALSQLWQGEFATVWRSPPGYRGKLLLGARGPAVGWLRAQLARQDHLDAQGGERYDTALQQRLQGFQLAHGLRPDGVAGATTFMLLNRLADVDEPSLVEGRRAARGPVVPSSPGSAPPPKLSVAHSGAVASPQGLP